MSSCTCIPLEPRMSAHVFWHVQTDRGHAFGQTFAHREPERQYLLLDFQPRSRPCRRTHVDSLGLQYVLPLMNSQMRIRYTKMRVNVQNDLLSRILQVGRLEFTPIYLDNHVTLYIMLATYSLTCHFFVPSKQWAIWGDLSWKSSDTHLGPSFQSRPYRCIFSKSSS